MGMIQIAEYRLLVLDCELTPNPDKPEKAISKSQIISCFFRGCAQKKWPFRGNGGTEHLTTGVAGVSA